MDSFRKTILDSAMVASAIALMTLFGLRTSTTTVAPVNVTLIGSSARPETQTTIYSMEGCAPCLAYLADVNRQMPPAGWTIKDSADPEAATAHIVVCKSLPELQRVGIDRVPCTVIRKRGREVSRTYGRQTPDDVADKHNAEAKKP